MNVEQLIEKLQQYPYYLEVYTAQDFDFDGLDYEILEEEDIQEVRGKYRGLYL
ncbi:hypothetical protein ACI1UE_10490 [Lactococcus petauri]|uniref:hypothetical protein n=1 Tax=Lactococcus TaxID=1357 RepID=UPI001A8E4205|nr:MULTISPECIES: hypothetical protein [Lactococcus]QSQ99552.1 hypothetical protein J0J34_05535 [Lactococcus garvieae]USI66765.1 hypothetical protein LMK05_05665 [Lactococcus petauri]